MSVIKEFEERVLEIARPVLKEAGIDLIEHKVSKRQKRFYIQFIADHPDGGITLDECAHVNRLIIRAMEDDGGFEDDDYVLEFSSPGLDRPLKTLQDFGRVLGRPIQFFLTEEYEGRIQYDGVLKGIEEDSLVIDLNEEELLIPITKVNKGLQIIEEG